MMSRINNIDDAVFLLEAPVVCFDIETDTTPAKEGYAARLKDEIGLSYLAEMTDIGFYAGPEYPEVAFTDLHVMEEPYRSQIMDFIRQVLTRPITYVGHNVVFDFRTTGGHIGFLLHPEALIWDTQVMQSRLLLVDQLYHKAYRTNILAEGLRWGLLDEPTSEWYEWMKTQRGTLSDLAKTVAALPPDHAAWKFCGGFMPNAADEKARTLRENYVAMDARLSFEIYQKQLLHAQTLAVGESSPRKKVRVMKWDKLPERLLEHQQLMRLACNQAIRGIPVDRDYLMQMETTAQATVEQLGPEVFNTPDPTDPYPNFMDVFSQVIWYSMALDKMGPQKKTYSAPTGWVNWKWLNIDMRVIRDAMQFNVNFPSEAAKEAALDKWCAWLASLTPEDTAASVLTKLDEVEQAARKKPSTAKKPKKPVIDLTDEERQLVVAAVPYINIQEWVRQQCFSGVDYLYGNYFAFLKTRWLKTYYRSHERESVLTMINKDVWKPYYLYVVAGWDLPASEDIQFNFELTTDSFKAAAEGNQRQGITVDLQELAIKMNAFSTSTKVLDWIFKRIEEMEEAGEDMVDISEQLRNLRNLWQAIATRDTCRQYLAHSERDGCLHSLIVPAAQTTRGTSTHPNLQNVKMDPTKEGNFAGVFVAPEGFHLVEVDLSNAENVTGAMISGDNNFSYATAVGDFHAYNAAIYFKDAWETAQAAGDSAALKGLRKVGKNATFAIPYGVGPTKLASMIKTDYQTARDLMDARKAAFPQVEEAKLKYIRQCEQRLAEGFTPPYTTLWNGDRVVVDSTMENGRQKIQGYTLWNYQQQGGVAAMVHAACIKIDAMLRENSFRTYIVFDVHDALILAVDIKEYFETDVIQRILQIFCNQVPDRLIHRTNPPVHFVAETCPSNKFKWGKRADGVYPFPMDEFINQWGRWKLPEDILALPEYKREAPTWKGPIHEGWTLDGEIEAIKQRQIAAEAQPERGVIAAPVVSPWEDMIRIFDLLDTTTVELRGAQAEMSVSRRSFSLQYTDSEGVQQTTPPMTYAERMQVLEALFHKGHTALWMENIAVVQKMLALRSPLRAVLEALDKWAGSAPDYINKGK